MTNTLTPEEQEAVNERFLAAAKAGDLAKVKAAYAEGAQLKARDGDKDTALMLAAWKGKDAVVEFLLNKGADVNAQDKWRGTALFYAARNGYAGIVKQLFEAGADVNLQADNGSTALIAAAYYGYDQIAELLLACGAKIELADKDGNAVANAEKQGHEKLAARLREVLKDDSKRPTLESVGLDMDKRNAALAKLGKPAEEVHAPQTNPPLSEAALAAERLKTIAVAQQHGF